MLGHEHCRNLPTFEECQNTAASLISDPCLRDCIIGQCRRAEPICAASAQSSCAVLSSRHAVGRTGDSFHLGRRHASTLQMKSIGAR